ncbi:MAG: transcription-repair coupling factor [Gammaproteobacteria bacterium]|nr:transcription-repair coupling factor [Gammaproteobacteria bacterium]
MSSLLLARSDCLPAPGQTIVWCGLAGCGTALALAELVATRAQPLLVLTCTVAQAEALEGELQFFLGDTAGVALFPDLEVLPYDSFSPHQDLVSARLRILRDLRLGHIRTVIAAAPTVLPRLAPVDHLQRNAIRIARGEALALEAFARGLDQAGYSRVTQVSAHGEYAVRGSLVDFFPMAYEQPMRVDFLDDAVESIRCFDPDTQISSAFVEQVDTLPARELPTDDESTRAFRQRYRRRFEGNPAASAIYREVSERRLPGGVENWLPLFFDTTATLWDYLPPDTLVATAGDVHAALEQAWQQAGERFEQLGADPERPLLRPGEVFCPPDEHAARLATHGVLRLEPGAASAATDVVLAAGAPPALVLRARDEDPAARLRAFLDTHDERLFLVAESASRREWLHDLLVAAGAAPAEATDWASFRDGTQRCGLAVAAIGSGLALPAAGLLVLSEQELSGQPARQRPRRRRGRDAEALISDLTDLRPGTPVVHLDHGVGRYVGLTRLDIDGAPAEFVTLEYAGGDRLHVPVGSLHLIERYTGAAAEAAPLHRLGTDQWARARRRAAERIRDVAAELLDLYSRRAARPGHAVRADGHGYASFAAGFPFTLTEDQAGAIEAVLGDLAAARPMDRLVCGDVGFGKTEVALRAAFVVATSGRQVAVLVPTTLLAQQHHETFADRFADWPVTVEVLSRFRSAQEHRQVLERLAAGQVDIIIGTHRLLQKDVRFRDLGLVIVDEEHRFGVRHKEQLKNLRAEVDILTLTATPIPRTLNMALGGVRELSLIATPPESRLAIKTFVSAWSGQLIREACLRELKRGGQIYFVHNRIQDIAEVARQVAQIVPEARAEVAHGQMPERELERVMLDFYHRRFEILVCTAIIESGLDVPTANTIIIDHAEQFGLAQLHQLRGRVGRSHHQAFAYLIAPPREALQGDARKRLEALEALEDLGAGFVLATHDLEIRGAGELLGEDQSGQIQEIGFTLYHEMLGRAVRALQEGRDIDTDATGGRSPDIDLHIPALLPEEYLPDIHLRLVLYKRIAGAPDDDALDALATEIADRFGHLPEPTSNLLRIAALRLRCAQAGIARLQAGPGGGSVEFSADTPIDPAGLVGMIGADPRQFRLDPRQRLVFRRELPEPRARLDYVAQMVSRLAAMRRDDTTTPRRQGGMA